ncbi:hypothetical protein RHSIM_Rhsim05G0222700 [Rhododendron simsii]|uniref:Tetratricopeptide repeat (TPR)-like superfamily protein n=1 Tax=Rhododendron simsii TaxID=118357 RepID=A0A834GY27_RHOSS|nr:hypothetical protein RHSIM_Rhsim05G0222700 [Rhododendron simsii]
MVFRQFKDKGIDLNVVFCTSVIASCSQNCKDMEAVGPIQRDAYCWGKAKFNKNRLYFTSLRKHCSIHGKASHSFSIRSGISGYVYVGSALVDMYAKCGRMETSCPFFDELRRNTRMSKKWFEEAVEAGHVDSLVGVARTKYKRGHEAYKSMNSRISVYSPVGWTYQVRSLYCIRKENMMDLDTATELDPTLPYPYEYSAVLMMEENNVDAAIQEINRIICYRVSPNCLELRAWFSISMGDYERALIDVRAILTFEPNYMMFHGKLHGDHLVDLLCHHVQQWSQAESGIGHGQEIFEMLEAKIVPGKDSNDFLGLMDEFAIATTLAVLMDDHKEAEAISELSKAISFKPDLQLLHLHAAFHDSMGDYISTPSL